MRPKLTPGELRGMENREPLSSSIVTTVSFFMVWKLYKSPVEITDLCKSVWYKHWVYGHDNNDVAIFIGIGRLIVVTII